MTMAYFDAFAGAAGDMILGALIAAGGLDVARIAEPLAGLGVGGWRFDVRRENRRGLQATRLDVVIDGGHEHHHRTWADIRAMIRGADLPPRAAERAEAVFARLAEAEGRVHGKPADEVHFHEVGAVDSIVDIVGAAVALELLGIDRVQASPLPPGSGTVRCAHGELPVPAPATAELLKGIPLRESSETGELTTPTGAAVLAVLAERFGPMPAMTVGAIGYGAGSREGRAGPNVLRVVLGEPAGSDGGEADADAVWQIETNLDDATAEVLADACERVLAAGAVDVWTTPATMKKGRSGWVVSCLSHEPEREAVERTLFETTGTFGVRRVLCARSMLRRETVEVATPQGRVRMKVGRLGDRRVRVAPEYEDCRRAADAAGVSVREVMDEALAAWREVGE